MKKIKHKILKVIAKIDNSGSAFVDLAVKIGIGVVAGSLILTVVNAKVPAIFGNLFSQIENMFTTIEG